MFRPPQYVTPYILYATDPVTFLITTMRGSGLCQYYALPTYPQAVFRFPPPFTCRIRDTRGSSYYNGDAIYLPSLPGIYFSLFDVSRVHHGFPNAYVGVLGTIDHTNSYPPGGPWTF